LGSPQKPARLDEIVERHRTDSKFSEFHKKLETFISLELQIDNPSALIEAWTPVSCDLLVKAAYYTPKILNLLDHRIQIHQGVL
jgi:hypothetical protein